MTLLTPEEVAERTRLSTSVVYVERAEAALREAHVVPRTVAEDLAGTLRYASHWTTEDMGSSYRGSALELLERMIEPTEAAR